MPPSSITWGQRVASKPSETISEGDTTSPSSPHCTPKMPRGKVEYTPQVPVSRKFQKSVFLSAPHQPAPPASPRGPTPAPDVCQGPACPAPGPRVPAGALGGMWLSLRLPVALAFQTGLDSPCQQLREFPNSPGSCQATKANRTPPTLTHPAPSTPPEPGRAG